MIMALSVVLSHAQILPLGASTREAVRNLALRQRDAGRTGDLLGKANLLTDGLFLNKPATARDTPTRAQMPIVIRFSLRQHDHPKGHGEPQRIMLRANLSPACTGQGGA